MEHLNEVLSEGTATLLDIQDVWQMSSVSSAKINFEINHLHQRIKIKTNYCLAIILNTLTIIVSYDSSVRNSGQHSDIVRPFWHFVRP